jgi:hypothetical protein
MSMDGLIFEIDTITAQTGAYPGQPAGPKYGDQVMCDVCGSLGTFGKDIKVAKYKDPFNVVKTRLECVDFWACLSKRKDSLRR